MKLKFIADSKDWIMFGVYAGVLLYFVAIAVLNLAQFAAGDIDKPFHGFNPFPAFGPGYIGITLVLYVVALVASILSVSDRFFDVEKGLGISTGKKKEKGYSKWLEEREFKKAKDIESVAISAESATVGGIPLMNDGKRIWLDNGEGHSIVMGSSGSGKTQMIVVPMVKSLAKNNESMVITDPKGEIYEKTSKMLKEKGYNVVLLNFRNPQQGSGWNPLHLPYQYYKKGNSDKANELIDDLAVNILYDQNAQNQDPFWEKTSADYFSGLCLALFEDAREDEINLNSVNLFTTVGEEKCSPNATYVNEYFNTKDPASPAYVSASSTLIAPNETKGSILSVFKQKLRLFASRENISEMLSHSDFEMEDIGKMKTAVFIIIQDEKTTYHSLVTIFIKQCYETLIDYAQKCGGKLPFRTNFVLDEFANLPPLKDVETMVSAARSRNMRFTFFIQNFAQLSEKYGKNKSDTIKGNCSNIIYLISTEIAALEEISTMCGDQKVKSGKGDKAKEETRPLITVSDLQKLSMGEVIVLRARLDPLKTKLKMDYEINWPPLYASQDAKDAVYPSRAKEQVHIFDLKGFVNKKKEERINQIISGNMGKTPITQQKKSAKPGTKAPGNIDVDALVKKIDARIAELEAEETPQKASPIKGGSIPATPVPAKAAKPATVAVSPELRESIKRTAKQEKPPVIPVPVPFKMPAQEPVQPAEPKVVQSPVVKPVASHDFAAKITNKVNSAAKTKNQNKEVPVVPVPIIPKPVKKTEQARTSESNNYVSDDQFFDDFFADDEDV